MNYLIGIAFTENCSRRPSAATPANKKTKQIKKNKQNKSKCLHFKNATPSARWRSDFQTLPFRITLPEYEFMPRKEEKNKIEIKIKSEIN